MFEFLSFIGQYVCFFILHVCGGGAFPKPLSEKQEREALEKCRQGDKKARQLLIEHNLRLVAHIIKKYYGKQNEQDDLVSVGTIGLIKAVDTFQPDRNIRLSSYASRCIENEILMYFRAAKKRAQDVSLNETIDTDKDGNPLTLMELIIVLRYGLNGKKPQTQKEIADRLGISRSYVSRLETKALKQLRKKYEGNPQGFNS